MTGIRLLTLPLSILALSACTSQAESTAEEAITTPDSVEIRFLPQVLDRPFACGDTFEDIGSEHTTITPADLRFYVQDLALIDDQGKTVPVELDERSPWQAEQVALLDFQDDQGDCSGTPDTNGMITGHVPHGTYTGVSFSNGVPEALNHEDPLQYSAPLQVTDLSWGWLTGFRFFVAEVHDVDAAGSGIGLLHIGSTACTGLGGDSRCTRSNRNHVELHDFDPKENAIVVDVGELFSGSDVSVDSQCHSAGDGADVCPAMAQRLGLDFSNGEASPETQRVYRVAQVK